MALGTALTAATAVSTTAGSQSISLVSGGVSVAENSKGGKLTVFLMSNHHDYEGNEPPSGGDKTQIRMYYQEYTGTSRDPQLKLTFTDSSVSTHYAIGAGDDDDGYIINSNLNDTVNWTTLRGDVDTVGASRNVTLNNSFNGVYAYHAPGRGSDVIRDIRRSFFVFDLTLVTKTVASGVFVFYMDNFGSTGDSGEVIAVQGTALAGSTADFGNCFVADAVTVTDNATFFGANF
jgi:hypothetical protein